MKKFFWAFPLLSLLVLSTGCKLPPVTLPPSPLMPTPTPSSTPVPPTSTPTFSPTTVPFPSPVPTVNPNSICGFSQVTTALGNTPTNLANLQVPIYYGSTLNGPVTTWTAIRSLADWQNWCGNLNPVPAPPVNFSQQMIVIIPAFPPCPMTTLNNICEGTTEISFNFTTYLPPGPVGCLGQIPTTVFRYSDTVAIPQSGLPFVVHH